VVVAAIWVRRSARASIEMIGGQKVRDLRRNTPISWNS
jgi:hypothetical protein